MRFKEKKNIGDKKYGAKRNPLGRLWLYAKLLEFSVPGYKNTLVLEAKEPQEFTNMFLEKESIGKNVN